MMDGTSTRATPASPGRDRRAERSGAALRAALLRLVERKPFEHVTVREIAAEAGVHYATFFRHHASKEALLDRVAADQIDRLVELTLPVLDSASGAAAFDALARYIEDHRTVWTALLTGGAAAAMRAELLGIARRLAAERATLDGWLPADLAATCSVSLIFETLAWWLAKPPGGVAPSEVAAMMHRLVAAVAQVPDFGAGTGNEGKEMPS